MKQPTTPVLKVSHLSVKIEGFAILRDVSFELQQGETLVVIGPNGAGKTVLLKALLGLIPHTGEIEFRGDLKLGYVPQRVPLNRDLPVSVLDFFFIKGVNPENTLRALEQVGITDPDFLKKPLGALSSGQFQRVLIAWSVVNKPHVLLFDEPTSGVDVTGEETIHTLLHKMQEALNLTTILVTHDLNVVCAKATQVLCLNKQQVCYGKPKDILTADTLKSLYGGDVKFFEHTHV